jgi:hypothetical protein
MARLSGRLRACAGSRERSNLLDSAGGEAYDAVPGVRFGRGILQLHAELLL